MTLPTNVKELKEYIKKSNAEDCILYFHVPRYLDGSLTLHSSELENFKDDITLDVLISSCGWENAIHPNDQQGNEWGCITFMDLDIN